MSDKDDRIVDFNELKNKAREKDIDKFEQYIYSLYYSLAQGEISMADFSIRIGEYMEQNDISYEKFFNIQKEMMKRYGLDPNDLEAQMENLGINMPKMNPEKNYENMRKALSFGEKYKDKLSSKLMSTYSIHNNSNEIDIILENENVIIKSCKTVDLKDSELNEFLCSYKKVLEDKALNVSIYENVTTYQY
ncbi:DUF3867 domain-containing protein [Clostridium sp. MSJ-4]|uniref:DUF3867 domain-containing protein n=1 Tax=Clostridium simiarum TaxID=2841506 RepID=A0ABS6F0D5_9CLOT|nr:DUF3867 domain-containing protein [Clostridium simiarum]MBU5591957.1 DUF3867 domain-containing protein [Clostridium simiarum]